MADKVVGLRLEVDGAEAVKTVGSFKAQLREATAELIEISEKFGATSVEAAKAAQKVAGLKDAIGDAKDLADAFSPDRKFDAFSKSLQGVTGGFAALQGAQALFGSESEDLQKTLLKVQSAMALSEGLNSVLSAKDAFTNLGAVIKTKVVTSFTTLRGAVIATGLGAAAVAIGLLIANFDKVKQVVLNFIPGLGKVADFLGGIIQKVTDFIGVTSEAERQAEKSLAAMESRLKDSERFLELNGDKYDQYTQRKIKADIDYQKRKIDLDKEEGLSAEERAKRLQEIEDKRNREILAANKGRQDEIDKVNEESQKKANEIQKKNAAEADRIRKEAAAKAKAAAKEAAAEEAKANDELSKLRQERIATEFHNDNEAERIRIRQQAANDIQRINALKVSEETKIALRVEFRKKEARDLEVVEDKIAEEQAAREAAAKPGEVTANRSSLAGLPTDEENAKRAEEIIRLTTSETDLKLLQLDLEYARKRELIKGNEEAELKLKQEFEQAKLDVKRQATEQEIGLVGNALQQISDIVGQQTVAGKVLAIAAATINTYKAASNAFASVPFPFNFVATGAVIAQGLAQVKKILSVQVPGKGGGGSAGGPTISATAPIAPTVGGTRLDQSQVNQIGNAAAGGVVRAFVTESDVTSNQEKISRINRAARLG